MPTNLSKIKGSIILLCIIAFFVPTISKGQIVSSISISESYTDQSLSEILNDLSDKYPIEVYYKGEDLPKTKSSYKFDNASVESVIETLLSKTLLSYIFYQEHAIVILPRSIANKTFTVDYYKAREDASQTTENKPNKTIGRLEDLESNGIATLSGIIRDEEENEPIIGANVIIQNLDMKTITGIDGDFSFDVPAGIHYLNISYVGYEDIYMSVRVQSSGELRLTMEKGAIVLDEITVSAKTADEAVNSTQAAVTKLDVGDIKKLPAFLGETDVVKTLLLNTGVSSAGEGATGFNVRGGDVDQNLILQDNGILLNSSHSLGFFSYFNTDFIEDVELYKAIMPAQYGGRLSAVLDVKTKDGDYSKFNIRGGVGPITSRLSLDGPIVKDKVSFIVGGRGSYANWILRRVENLSVRNSSIFFYDVNGKISAKLGKKNTLIFSGYASEDEFGYNNEFGFNYANYTGQMILKSIFNNKLYSNFSLSYNDYVSSRFDYSDETGSKLDNDVTFYRFKERITYSPTTRFKLDMGISSILYEVDPGNLEPLENSIIIGRTVDQEQGLESAAFANLEYDFSPNFGISAGLRFSDFKFLGPSSVLNYENNENPSNTEITGETVYEPGKIIASHSNLEPRFSMRYRINDVTSLKSGYSRTVQYINQIFNSDTPTPVSQWQLSNSFIQPNTSHNVSAGYFRNFDIIKWETNAEVFYRYIDQLFDYKDFAQLTANPNIETEILYGTGQSYGFEFSLKKKEGVVNGTFNYTYSRSQRKIEGINNGNYYSSNFDKPHDLSFVFNYQPNRRNTITLNFIYASGRPTTPPVGNYTNSDGLVIPVFANRNAGRIPDYHRLDLSFTMGKGYKRDKKFATSWTFSLYNVYARKNAFSVYFTEANQQGYQANKLAILGTVFPSLTFNFETL